MNRIVLVVSSLIVLAGCSANPVEPDFDERKSLALNIANASDINKKRQLSDRIVPKGSMKPLGESVGLNVAWAGANAFNSAFSASSLGFGALAIAESLLGPQSYLKQNNLVAWMPADMAPTAEEAQILLARMVADSVVEAIKASGGDAEITGSWGLGHTRSKGNYLTTHAISVKNYESCRREDGSYAGCSVLVATNRPVANRIAPRYMTGEPFAAWQFMTRDYRDFSTVEFYLGNEKKLFPQFFVALGQKLPDWAALYVRHTQNKDEAGTAYPYILKSGKVELFAVEE